MKVETVEIYTTDTTVARWFHPQDLRSSWSRHLHTASRFTLDLVLRWLRKPWWRCWAADLVMEFFNMEMLPIRVFMYLDNVPISSYIYILCTILILLVNYYVYMIIWLCIVYTYIKLSGTMCHCTISTVCNAHSAFLTSESRSPACPNLNLLGAPERRTERNHKATMSTPPAPPLNYWYVLSSRCTESHVHQCNDEHTTTCIGIRFWDHNRMYSTRLQNKIANKIPVLLWALCDMLILLISFCSTMRTSALAVAVWSISVADRVVKTSTGKP